LPDFGHLLVSIFPCNRLAIELTKTHGIFSPVRQGQHLGWL
jgi:hypothetical protein